jgi:2-hydroxycyclohexanecarboxyl-CoA dehydrogenase
MLDAGWGRVVTIASSSAQSGAPRMAHYAASKGGVISLTKALAACTDAVELGLAASPGLLTARIRAAPEQLAAIEAVLAELSPERLDDRLELRFVRPQLDVV